MKLGQLVFKCQWSVLSSMSLVIKAVLGEDKEVDRVIDSSSFGITRHGDEMYSGYCIDSTVYRCVQWHTRFGWNIMVLSVAYSHKVYC